jgi:beta-mannosidase
MITQKLHDNWKMRNLVEKKFIPAEVPGSVYADLLRNGKMEDPFWRDNENSALPLMDSDYEYVTTFDANAELLDSDKIILRCLGLDTLAGLTLNGKKLGQANNMHRIWEYDVTRKLRAKKNELKIRFYSPTKAAAEAHQAKPVPGNSDALDGFPQIRKAHCMYGWDWGPRLPDAGIWRDIMLLGIHTARLDSVYITQKHRAGRVTLGIQPEIEKLNLYADSTWGVTLTAPDGTVKTYEGSPKQIVVENPRLWWPRGYGEQPLYTVKVTLFHGRRELDSWERRIGLRAMTVNQKEDKWGARFAHEVNGVCIFAMGADYIPEDNILSRVTPERTRTLLEQCATANFNAIRVWGGGYYPNDFFFDICDELGIVVWQDFMFACAAYDLTEEFEANVRAEFADNIKRLRHHASLGLWCGNNEIESFAAHGVWVNGARLKADYIKLFEYILPQMVKQYDPQTFYWPSSPSSGGGFDNPDSPDQGDVHYWSVWHGDKPFSEYRKFYFRYLSEFGFQSFPAMKTVEQYTLPEDRNIFSYVMDKHQRNNSANGKISNYMYQTFLYPTSFAALLYASQLLQAEAIKYGVEHFRRNRGRCMGTLYWQLNDCWPVASWASIDYFFRWKALHYYAKRFFAPMIISCHEEGFLTQNPNVNAQPRPFEKSFRLSVANETMGKKNLLVKWEIRDARAKVLRESQEEVSVSALSPKWLSKVNLPDIAENDQYLSYHLYEGDALASEGTAIFSIPRLFHYQDPKLTCRVSGDKITVKAAAYAKSVEILNENEDLVLSDNYFDMNSGEKAVRIISGKPDGLKLRSVYDIR